MEVAVRSKAASRLTHDHELGMPRSKLKSKKQDLRANLRFTVTPGTSDELVLRLTIQNAMEQTFGLTRAFTYFDFSPTGTGDEMGIQVSTL